MSRHTLSFLFRGKRSGSVGEIPELWPFPMVCDIFTANSLRTTYNKILIDTFERAHGLSEEHQPLLWDNCVQSENSRGLISLLVDAMVSQNDLFLVYKPGIRVLRKANAEEEKQIKEDYALRNESSVGVYISFKNYRTTEMLKIYATLEFCVLLSFHKNVNIAKAVQIKMHEMRSSVSVADSSIAIDQAKAIAEALSKGRDVLLDRNDDITTTTPDITPTEKSLEFIDTKRAYILNAPKSYVSGELAGGLGDSGNADMRAVERCLKAFFFSIVQPVCKVVFDDDVKFKSQDNGQMETGMEAMKTFDLTSERFLSLETQRQIVWRLFDVDPEEEQKRIDSESNDDTTFEDDTQSDAENTESNAPWPRPTRGEPNQ